MADKNTMAEDTAFRVDEHERRLGAMEEVTAPNALLALVRGMFETLQAGGEQHTEKLLKAITADAETDRQVIAAVKENTQAVRDLIEVLKTPVQRTSTVNLPTGPVSVVVQERRN